MQVYYIEFLYFLEESKDDVKTTLHLITVALRHRL